MISTSSSVNPERAQERIFRQASAGASRLEVMISIDAFCEASLGALRRLTATFQPNKEVWLQWSFERTRRHLQLSKLQPIGFYEEYMDRHEVVTCTVLKKPPAPVKAPGCVCEAKGAAVKPRSSRSRQGDASVKPPGSVCEAKGAFVNLRS
ncbi:unnamed protein product [Closterium sp. Yama58-4]|nr:unnamed protein product [Closterium sp. Yama58-4]